jgi:hypothetical protein
LHNKLKNTPDTNNINEEWERIKEAITDAANEVIQIQSRTPRNEWWDEEGREHIKKETKQDPNGSNKTQEQAKKHIRR